MENTMKPDDWDSFSTDTKEQLAKALCNSERGRLIFAQALSHAIYNMRKMDFPEKSNIEDMEMLGETLFQPWFSFYQEQLDAAS
jgi:hypothetical protein